MALTNATIDGAWTLQLKNVALQGRFFAGAFFAEANASTTSLSKYRAGVVPKDSASGIFGDGKVLAKGSPSLSLDINPGYFIIDRPSQGPYVAFSSAVVSVTVATADATNPRLDLIVARVEDTGIGDSNLWAQIQVITGTPAGSPVAPAAPTGSIPLATARVDALATTITNAKITDLRKSAGLAGAIRRLLPGDALADVGFYDGEIRDSGTGLDRWTDASSSWVPIGTPFASATPRGVQAEVKRGTTDNVTSAVVLESATINVINGRRYRITWSFNWSASVASGPPNSSVTIRTASGASITTSSTSIRATNLLITNSTTQSCTLVTTFVASANEQRTFGCTATSNGAPTLTLAGGSDQRILLVEDVGV